MKENRSTFKPGTLWNQIKDRSERARKLGALHAIRTTSEFVQQHNLQFLVRIVSNLAKKEQQKIEEGFRMANPANPFLPYEKDLWVADISQTHICLLNKFNVIENHILLVTRAFEDQESLLTVEDFEALWICMAEFDGLAFYNSGSIAGASQQHKHLQIVPLPLAATGPKVPMGPALITIHYQKGIGISSNLAFVHAISAVQPQWVEDPKECGERTWKIYFSLLEAVGLLREGREKSLGAYNLVITRQWMFLIPRSRECFDSISINALGFAGALLVKNKEEMHKVKQVGPLRILQEVAVPH